MPPTDAAARRRVAACADSELVIRTRAGDSHAYRELWRRHFLAGTAVARSVSPGMVADDLVREAYTRVHRSIEAGAGPQGAFRAFLFASICNTAAAWGRTSAGAGASEQNGAAADLVRRSYAALPPRWQEALWYSEVERMPPARIGPLLGMRAPATLHVVSRARTGLRTAWVAEHRAAVTVDSPCHDALGLLAASTAGSLSRRDRANLDAHLAGCERCRAVAVGVDAVGGSLALALLPPLIGVAATANHLAIVHGAAPGRAAAPPARRPGSRAGLLVAAAAIVATTATAALAASVSPPPATDAAPLPRSEAAALPNISLSEVPAPTAALPSAPAEDAPIDDAPMDPVAPPRAPGGGAADEATQESSTQRARPTAAAPAPTPTSTPEPTGEPAPEATPPSDPAAPTPEATPAPAPTPPPAPPQPAEPPPAEPPPASEQPPAAEQPPATDPPPAEPPTPPEPQDPDVSSAATGVTASRASAAASVRP